MALQEQTARAVAKSFAISYLLSGIAAIPMGLFMAIVGPFAPAATVGEQVVGAVVFVTLGLGYAVLGALSALLGLGLWNHQRWGRIVMIVLSWLGAAAAVLLLLVALGFGALSATVPELAGVGAAFTIVLGVMALLFAALMAVHLWIFQFDPTVRSLYVRSGSLLPVLDKSNVLDVTRGWAVLLGVHAVMGVLVAPAIVAIGMAASQVPEGEILLIGMLIVGVMALLFSVLLGLLAWGVWRLKQWARIVSIALAYLFGAFGAGYALLMPFAAAVSDIAMFDVLNGIVAGVVYMALAALQVWYFQCNADVKKLFSAAPSTGHPPAAVKKKRS